jgi:hypothetical protein
LWAIWEFPFRDLPARAGNGLRRRQGETAGRSRGARPNRRAERMVWNARDSGARGSRSGGIDAQPQGERGASNAPDIAARVASTISAGTRLSRPTWLNSLPGRAGFGSAFPGGSVGANMPAPRVSVLRFQPSGGGGATAREERLVIGSPVEVSAGGGDQGGRGEAGAGVRLRGPGSAGRAQAAAGGGRLPAASTGRWSGACGRGADKHRQVGIRRAGIPGPDTDRHRQHPTRVFPGSRVGRDLLPVSVPARLRGRRLARA